MNDSDTTASDRPHFAEIEITEDMVRAGAKLLWDHDAESNHYETARAVLEAALAGCKTRR